MMRGTLLIVLGGAVAAVLLIVSANLLVLATVPEWMAIVPADRAMAFAKLCSRPAPTPIQGVWTPSVQHVRRVERHLPIILEEELRKAGRYAPSTNAADYARQYAGLIVDRSRIVYVNGFYKHPWLDRSMFTLWGSEPVHVCDGGESAFGVEFDVATEEFKNFRFNSAIEPRP